MKNRIKALWALKQVRVGVAVLAVGAFGVGITSGAGADGVGHTPMTICHHAGPFPDNWHTITIDDSAWPAHEAHGDTQGPCEEVPPTTTTPPPTTTTPPTTTEQPPVTVTEPPVNEKPVPEPGSTKKSQQAAKQAQQAVNSGTALLPVKKGGPRNLGG